MIFNRCLHMTPIQRLCIYKLQALDPLFRLFFLIIVVHSLCLSLSLSLSLSQSFPSEKHQPGINPTLLFDHCCKTNKFAMNSCNKTRAWSWSWRRCPAAAIVTPTPSGVRERERERERERGHCPSLSLIMWGTSCTLSSYFAHFPHLPLTRSDS